MSDPALPPARIPARINVGSGRLWDEAALNIDISAAAGPDIVADLSDPALLGRSYPTHRFGEVELAAGAFRHITASHVLEHVPNLVGFMTNCLELLEEGGTMAIRTPYDLSYGAWQDPTHVRAFNERSWLYYTSWHWQIGWEKARFEIVGQHLVLSPLGRKLRQAGTPPEDLRLRPRAVDEVTVEFRKRAMSAAEREAGLAQASRHLRSRPELRHPAPRTTTAGSGSALYLDLLLAWVSEDGGAGILGGIRAAAEQALDGGVAGDFVAAGALAADRGAILAGVLRSRPRTTGRVWIATNGAEDATRARLRRFRLLDDRIDLLPGGDRDRLAHAPVERVALLTIGGDAEAVAAILPALFDRMAPGGTILVDPAGKLALDAFLAHRRIDGATITESADAVCWRRPIGG